MMRRLRHISYLEQLMLLYLAGSVGGGILANLLGGELLEQIGSFGLMQEAQWLYGEERKTACAELLKQRMLQLGMGCLAGMTPLAAWLFRGAALMAGGGSAVLITICTLYGGWLGIWMFLKAMMPQMMCYLPVIVILAAGAEHGTQNMKRRVWLLLLALTAVGAMLEAYAPLES